MSAIRRLGAAVINSVGRLGRGSLFLVQMLAGLVELVRRPSLAVTQLYSVGVLSLVIIIVSGLFVGMVLGLQGYYVLVDFGTEERVGQLAGLSLLRELGPVVTALLFAGRAGSALTAEIGLMRATEQLSSMEMMAVDPQRRVFAPRFAAGFIAMPLLAIIFSVAGVLGAYVIAVVVLGIDAGAFMSQMQSNISFSNDVVNGIIKSLVFGFVATWIALFEGYDAPATTEGVSRATTRTVVNTSLAVLGLDFILTAVMFE